MTPGGGHLRIDKGSCSVICAGSVRLFIYISFHVPTLHSIKHKVGFAHGFEDDIRFCNN